MKVQPINKYVKLLSVSLFTLMEEGEAFLHLNNFDHTRSTPSLTQQTVQIQGWINVLTTIDKTLPHDILELIKEKCALMNSTNIETKVNAAALTLMLLDDHYRIFSLDTAQTNSALLPVLSLQDIKPDMSLPKPTLL